MDGHNKINKKRPVGVESVYDTIEEIHDEKGYQPLDSPFTIFQGLSQGFPKSFVVKRVNLR